MYTYNHKYSPVARPSYDLVQLLVVVVVVAVLLGPCLSVLLVFAGLSLLSFVGPRGPCTL